MHKIVVFLFLSTLSIFAQTINIAVATNVSYAMDELKAEFVKTNPNIKVVVILGSSGKLTAQIRNGAPYGLFMSANMNYPEALYEAKIAITKPLVYTQGALALFSANKRDLSQGLQLLHSPNIKRIAIANPKTAPYGKAAFEAMHKAKVYESVQKKLVYAESIAQTLAYTINATEIGIVAKSSLFSPKMHRYKKDENYVDVQSSLYTPIKQGIVLLKYAKNSQEYRAFYDFILSQKAKKIFLKYGYIIS